MMRYFTAVARLLPAGVLMILAGSVAAQQAYPSKPIRFITPYAPGGATSVLARLVGQKPESQGPASSTGGYADFSGGFRRF